MAAAVSRGLHGRREEEEVASTDTAGHCVGKLVSGQSGGSRPQKVPCGMRTLPIASDRRGCSHQTQRPERLFPPTAQEAGKSTFAEGPLLLGDSRLTVTSHGGSGEESLQGHFDGGTDLIHESSALKTWSPPPGPTSLCHHLAGEDHNTGIQWGQTFGPSHSL